MNTTQMKRLDVWDRIRQYMPDYYHTLVNQPIGIYGHRIEDYPNLVPLHGMMALQRAFYENGSEASKRLAYDNELWNYRIASHVFVTQDPVQFTSYKIMTSVDAKIDGCKGYNVYPLMDLWDILKMMKQVTPMISVMDSVSPDTYCFDVTYKHRADILSGERFGCGEGNNIGSDDRWNMIDAAYGCMLKCVTQGRIDLSKYGKQLNVPGLAKAEDEY